MSLVNENGGVPAVMNVTPTGTANGGNCGGWGGDWGAWIILFLIFGMFGWGGMGGFGGGWGGNNAGLQGALTRADLCSEFNFNGLENSVRGVTQGLCDGFYAMQNSINGLGMNMMQGFHGVDNAICRLGNAMQQGFNTTNIAMMQGFNAAQAQAADCCCKTQDGLMQVGNQIERGFCQTNYNAATNTNAIIQNAHNDTDRIIARLDAMESSRKDEKIAEQAAEIQAYKQNAVFGARIDAATAEILRRSGHDCCGQFNGGWGNGCGNCGNC